MAGHLIKPEVDEIFDTFGVFILYLFNASESGVFLELRLLIM
jgi:hypothetical protein